MAHNHRPLKIREQSLWFWLGTFDGAPGKGTWNIGIRLFWAEDWSLTDLKGFFLGGHC